MTKVLFTRDLITTLCTKLDHEHESPLIIKKLVTENWLDKVEDLRYVPKARFEHWQVPLKLVDEICDYMVETEADDISHGFSHFVNYNLRPALDSYISGPVSNKIAALRDDAARRRDPDTWAARKMQRWWRNRQNRRMREKDQRLMNAALKDEHASEDFRRLSDKDSEKRRKARALARIAVAVRLWAQRHREKKKAKGAGRDASERKSLINIALKRGSAQANNQQSSKTGDDTGLATLLVKHSSGRVKDCEISRVLCDLFQRADHDDEESCLFCLHRLVTQNWIESMSDLDLLEDHHYETWKLPEKIVVMLKKEYAEYQDKNSYKVSDLGTAASSMGNNAVESASSICGWLSDLILGEPESASQSSRRRSEPSGRTRRL